MSVELRVEVSGDKPAVLLTRGSIADISCGGLKCDMGLDVPVGTQVAIRFPELPEGTSLQPDLMDGQIVRSESLGGVPDRVAIAFTKPLDCLELGAIAQTKQGARVAHATDPFSRFATSYICI